MEEMAAVLLHGRDVVKEMRVQRGFAVPAAQQEVGFALSGFGLVEKPEEELASEIAVELGMGIGGFFGFGGVVVEPGQLEATAAVVEFLQEQLAALLVERDGP